MKEKPKSCFVIMPISDQEGYEKGHFKRVYEHLIKPACEKAGFIPIRADDEVKTNYIVLDIIRKILDSDMVICDLSAKNPNVMYELGIRQSFNKKSILIKDAKTTRIFDIQGLRTIEYDQNLRIDEVQKNIESIASTLTATYEEKDEDVNSLIQLLGMKPASIPNTLELSKESSLILDAINDINNRLSSMEVKNVNNSTTSLQYNVNGSWFNLGDGMYIDGNYIGALVDVKPDSVVIRKDHTSKTISVNSPLYKKLTDVPW